MMERTLLENAFFSELQHSQYTKEASEIPTEIIKRFEKDYKICELPESEVDIKNGAWTFKGKEYGSDDPLVSHFTESAFRQLLPEVKLRLADVNGLPLSLVQYHYDEMKKNASRVIFELDDEVVTNVFKINSNFIPFSVVFDSLKDNNGYKFNQVLISDTKFRLMKLTDLDFDLGKDHHKFGWIFDGYNKRNYSKIQAQAGVFRMVCLNGLTVPHEASTFMFSRSRYNDYQSGISRFIDEVTSLDAADMAQRVKDVLVVAKDKYPNNDNVVKVFKACRGYSDESFGDQVLGWSVDTRKDMMKRSGIKLEREEWAGRENKTYGTYFDIIQRITSSLKTLSIMNQIQLQDYVGALLRTECKN